MKKLLYLLLILPLFGSCSSDDDNTPSEADLKQQKIKATQKLLAGTWEYDTPKGHPHRNREEFVLNFSSYDMGTRYFYSWDSTKQEYIKTETGVYELDVLKDGNVCIGRDYRYKPNNAPDKQQDTPTFTKLTPNSMTMKFAVSGTIGMAVNSVGSDGVYFFYTLTKVK